MHVMSSAAVRMGMTVVVGMAAQGCNDARRTTRRVNDGNGEERISNVFVRRAMLSDACSVTSTVIDAHSHSTSLFAVEGSTRVTPDGTQVANLIQQPCNAFLVAEEKKVDGSSVMVGCVQVNWAGTAISKDPSVDAHFGMLSVPDRYSGRGIGKLLTSAAEKFCRRELGREDIVLEIVVLTILPQLCVWYKTQGYEMGKILPFPRSGYVREGLDVKLQQMTKTIS